MSPGRPDGGPLPAHLVPAPQAGDPCTKGQDAGGGPREAGGPQRCWGTLRAGGPWGGGAAQLRGLGAALCPSPRGPWSRRGCRCWGAPSSWGREPSGAAGGIQGAADTPQELLPAPGAINIYGPSRQMLSASVRGGGGCRHAARQDGCAPSHRAGSSLPPWPQPLPQPRRVLGTPGVVWGGDTSTPPGPARARGGWCKE